MSPTSCPCGCALTICASRHNVTEQGGNSDTNRLDECYWKTNLRSRPHFLGVIEAGSSYITAAGLQETTNAVEVSSWFGSNRRHHNWSGHVWWPSRQLTLSFTSSPQQQSEGHDSKRQSKTDNYSMCVSVQCVIKRAGFLLPTPPPPHPRTPSSSRVQGIKWRERIFSSALLTPDNRRSHLLFCSGATELVNEERLEKTAAFFS